MTDKHRYSAAEAYTAEYQRRANTVPAQPQDGVYRFANHRDRIPYFLRDASAYLRRLAEQREAEEAGRQQWISDVKQRLGLVCAGDLLYLDTVARDYVSWPAGFPDGDWHVASDHTLTVPLDWPPECRCVLLDGEQVALGVPCPVHAAA